MLGDLTEWVTDIVESLGYSGVAFLTLLENLFPPIPSEVILPLAGFVAGRGDANIIGMVAAATVGSLAGAWILYGIAAAIGPVRMRHIVDRWGRYLRIDESDLARSEAWFDRYSGRAVLIGRCVPLIRSLVSIPAGYRRMAPLVFTLYTLVGSLMWNIALVGAGGLLGERWESVADPIGIAQWIVVAIILAAIVWFVWRRISRRSPTDQQDLAG